MLDSSPTVWFPAGVDPLQTLGSEFFVQGTGPSAFSFFRATVADKRSTSFGYLDRIAAFASHELPTGMLRTWPSFTTKIDHRKLYNVQRLAWRR